jgi:hypothetical protein
MWIYPRLISYPHLTYWHLIYSRGRLRIWSIGLSQSILTDCRFTWSVITLLQWTRPADDLPREEVHLDDEIPSKARNITVLGIRNNESFIFGKWRRSLLNVGDKYVDTYCHGWCDFYIGILCKMYSNLFHTLWIYRYLKMPRWSLRQLWRNLPSN